MKQYLAGFVYGMTGADHLIEVNHCVILHDPAEIAHTAKVAIDDIAEGRYFNGVRYFGKLLMVFPALFMECPGMLNEVVTI